jgi:hypothetical protein
MARCRQLWSSITEYGRYGYELPRMAKYDQI